MKAALAQVLAGMPSPRDIDKMRLPVDRVFTLRAIGPVATRTLTGGTLRRGQSVAIQSSGKVARIRNIQSYNYDVEFGVPGTSTALNLTDIAASDDVRRGDVVTLAELAGPATYLTSSWKSHGERTIHSETARKCMFTTAAPLPAPK